MSRCARRARVALALSATVLAAVAIAAPLRFGFGAPATPAQIAGWDIDVMPDGHGLPRGRGSVEQGQPIYDEKCASCHGTFGESNAYLLIAGGVGTLRSDQPVRSTGSKLQYATTLWDYINRAMPFNAPQTLTPDEVYALTAYVLNLNEIVPPGTVLDQDSLPKLVLPNRNGFTTNHGFMSRDGKPDTRNTACMKDCATQPQVTSELPAYARDQHGDVAAQGRAMGPTRAAGAPGSAVVAVAATTPSSPLDLAKASACTACHGVTDKVVGPGFREIAARYRGDPQAEAKLVVKLKAGGAGAWGSVPMPPQPQLGDAEAKRLVQWILAGAQ